MNALKLPIQREFYFDRLGCGAAGRCGEKTTGDGEG
jgi:hypothetical protein